MSLSNPRQENPARKFIDWSGSQGKFYYYDKESSKEVYFEDPIYIVPLDQLSTIKGFHSQSNSGIYSNQVRNISKDELVVKSFKGGLIAHGLYQNIKGKLDGGRFGKSIYAVLIQGGKDNPSLELVNFQLWGASLGVWIGARISVDSGEIVALSPSTTKLQKGSTTYYEPGIKKYKKRDDILQKCIDIDKELQSYLKIYLNTPSTEAEELTDVNVNNMADTTNEDGLPF